MKKDLWRISKFIVKEGVQSLGLTAFIAFTATVAFYKIKKVPDVFKFGINDILNKK